MRRRQGRAGQAGGRARLPHGPSSRTRRRAGALRAAVRCLPAPPWPRRGAEPRPSRPRCCLPVAERRGGHPEVPPQKRVPAPGAEEAARRRLLRLPALREAGCEIQFLAEAGPVRPWQRAPRQPCEDPLRVTMSPGRSQWPICLLVIACVAAGPSMSQECSAEKMGNTIIDINLSLPRGISGAEPVYAPSPEACVRACCSGEKLSGNSLLVALFSCSIRTLGRLILKFGLTWCSSRRDKAVLPIQHRNVN